MRLTFLFAAAIASTTMLATSAFAADYEPPVVTVDDPVEYVPVEVGSGWYLRGDIGYNFATRTSGTFDYRTFDALTGTYGQAQFDTARMRSDVTVGAGFGYRLNEWFRADATVEYFRARFDGTTTSATPCLGTPAFAGTTCRSEDEARVKALSFMLNAYVDLGTYVGFTPYAGAGVGYTMLTWEGLNGNNYCVGAACPIGLAGTSVNPGVKDWRFTYAAMAGVSYDISKNLKVDLGYRYRKISGGSMFNWDAASAALGATGVQGRDPGLSTHEIRLGLRYELW
ncbi:MAG: outer membrane protein [Rhizobiaceae bacterium]